MGGHEVAGDMPSNVDQVLSKPPKLRDLRAALAELTARTDQTAMNANVQKDSVS